MSFAFEVYLMISGLLHRLQLQSVALSSFYLSANRLSFFYSVHLYYLFPSLEEGGLATYRTAIVQNQHLAMLAKVTVY